MKLDILILVAQLPKPLRNIIIYSKKVSSREQNSYIRIDKPAGVWKYLSQNDDLQLWPFTNYKY